MKQRPRNFVWLATVVALLTAAAGALGWRANAHLRNEIARERAHQLDLARARELRERRETGLAAERERLNAERSGLEQLRTEAAQLQAALVAHESKQGAAPPAPRIPRSPATTAAQTRWINAGNASPAAAVQTLFWSAANGDAAALGSMLAFDAAAQAEAEQLFAGLPEDMRAEFGDARTLVAHVMSTRLPLGYSTAEIISEEPSAIDPLELEVRLRVARDTGKPRDINLRFRREPGGVRLLVPAQVVQGYRHLVLGTPWSPATSAP